MDCFFKNKPEATRMIRTSMVRDLLFIAVILSLLAMLLGSVDAFEWLYRQTRQHEVWELDEVIITVLVSPLFLSWFALRRWREAEKEINLRSELETQIIFNRKALLESEKKYKEIIENIPDLLYRTDTEGRITFTSPSVYGITGYTVDQFLGMKVEKIYATSQLRREFNAELDKHGAVTNFEAKLKHKNGSVLWVSSNARLLKDKNGDIVGVEELLRDISRRKQAEALQEAQQRILEHISRVHTPLEKIFNEIIHLTEDIYPTINASIQFFDKNESCYSAATSMPTAYDIMLDTRDIDAILGSLNTTLASREKIEDVSNNPLWKNYRQLGSEYGFRKRWLEPIVNSADKVIGVFTAYSSKNSSPVNDEFQLTKTMARLAGIAMESKTAEEKLRSQEHYFRSMDRIAEVLSSGNEVEQVLCSLVTTLLKVFEADRVWFLYPSDSQAGTYRISMEASRPEYPFVDNIDIELSIDEEKTYLINEALTTNGPVTKAFDVGEPDTDSHQIRSLMMLALRLSGKPPWLIGLHQCTYSRYWSDTERKLFQVIGQRTEDILGKMLLTERLCEVQAYAHIGHWEFDALSGQGYWSEEIYRIVGLDPEIPACPETLASILHPDDKDFVISSLETSLAEGTEHFAEYRILRPDAEERWLDCRGRPEVDAKGRVLRLSGFVQDVTDRKRSQGELELAAAEWTQAMDQFDDAIYLLDMKLNLVRANEAFFRMTGLDPKQSLGKNITKLIHHDSEEKLCMVCQAQKVGREAVFTLEPGELHNPVERPIEVTLKLIRNRSSTPNAMLMSMHDLTHSRKVEEHLRLAASVFDNTTEGISVTDTQGNIIQVNQAFTDITGYQSEEVVGKNSNVLKSGRHDKNFYLRLWRSLHETGQWRGEIWNRRKNGSIYPEWLTISAVYNDDEDLTHYVGIFSDISQIKHSKEQLDHLAHHDALTGLPNRMLLTKHIEQAIKRAVRYDSKFTIILLDLDRFKHINDSLGHLVGDQLLQEVAAKLLQSVSDDDTVARIGGDEFVVLMEGIGSTEDISVAIDRITMCFTEPFVLKGHEIQVYASFGICLYPQDGEGSTTLLRNADAAMYRAKEEGGNAYHFYSEELTHKAFERILLESNLRRALDQNELYLLYQPQVNLITKQVIGVEALIRWQHPELGLIPPSRFIPLAEESGLIQTIGIWVLRAACVQGARWIQQGIEFGVIGVNVAGPQIQRGNLPYVVECILEETGFPAERLGLEITEGFIMQRVESAITQLNQLRELEVTLSIDDFGTGYSSLSYLKQLPIHKLKIDQSFVKDIPENHNDSAISNAIIAMGTSLGLTVLAEGVETEDQAKFLETNGCKEAQGYLYSEPVRPDELAQYISELSK